MTISSDLFSAILAMDAYNRDYAQKLIIAGNKIGDATIGVNSSILVDANGQRLDQAASFFAQTYTLSNGQTVISFRGTDDPTDILTGWVQGLGYISTQAVLLR